jgi:predicted nuclease of predicted toxin-antitoxin system
MKVLLDTCVSGTLVLPGLAAAGHDVVWSGDWPSDPGDEAILARAHEEGRILVTLDKDFGALAVQQGKLHSGIVRLVNLATQDQMAVCLRVLADHGPALLSGAIITAERTRLRIRLPE